MLRNYLKIAWRNLVKNPLFTGLNLLGLSLGLAVSFLLLFYVRDELAFDRFHRQADRIHRVIVTARFDGKSQRWANAPNAVGPAVRERVSGVAEQVRLLKHNFGQSASVGVGEENFVEKNLFWVDSTLFNVFDVPLVWGDPRRALVGPNRIILSRSTAERYFGAENPVGQTLTIDNGEPLSVTGVFEDFPGNSTLDADLIGSFQTVKWASDPTNLSWSNASFETFLLLNPGTDPAQVQRQMAVLLTRNVPKAEQWFSLSLQALPDLHLHSADISNSYSTRLGDPRLVRTLGWLALLVLLIACINYMNLTTARSERRMKEVGINKAVGATRPEMARRFYLETALLVGLALVLSGAWLLLGRPLFEQLTGKTLALGLRPELFLGLLGIGAVVTVLAGAYPALYLSGFSPKHLLQKTTQRRVALVRFRQGLVVLQFAASIGLLVCTLVFYQQLRFVREQKLGYQPEQVVALTTVSAKTNDELDALTNEVRSLSEVVEVCRAQSFPGNGGSGRTLSPPRQPDRAVAVQTNRITSDFIPVLGLKLLAGRSLPVAEKAETDSTVQVVLNRTAVTALGYTPEQALGKPVLNLFGYSGAEIVGVVDDFHFDTFHRPIGAYAFHNARTEGRRFLLVKLRTAQLSETMKKLEAAFRQRLPNAAFEAVFLDSFLQNLYRAEQRTAQVFLVFSGLTILIACLGLFGLAAFTAEQRTKEIGVRKVLGASVGSIVALLSRDFLKLVFIALVLASPVAWWAMNQWLEGFAYKINIGWEVFALAGLLAVGIALLTVSFQSIKAALMNPVKSLRSE